MKKNWLLPLAFLVVMIIIMRYQGLALVTPVSPLGILDLEFARTDKRLQELRMFWNTDHLFTNIYLDFLFIISYVWFLVSVSLRIQKRPGWERAGKWAASFALAAGFFDVLENFLMIMIYQERFDSILLQMVFFLAVLKFALILLVLFFILAVIPFIYFKKQKRRGIPKS